MFQAPNALLASGLAVLLCSQTAFAQSADEDAPLGESPAADEAIAEDGLAGASTEDADETSAEQAVDEQEAEDDEAVHDALDQGATELPDKTYLFVGGRYRNVGIPTFVQGLFADGGESLFAHTPGLEFGIRQDGFEYILFGMLGFFGANDVPFKGKSDPNQAWEIIDMDYQILFLGSDFMWSTDEFAPGLSLIYGAGFGLGVVFGELTRTQAYPGAGEDVGNPDGYLPCEGPGSPDGSFCGNDNNHYNGFVEPSWADGGSSPIIFPWISGNLGLRYKVHRNFVTRVELGIMATGYFIGLAADYGL